MGGGLWFGPRERLWFKMFQIPWSGWLPFLLLLALVWSDLSPFLPLFSFMPALQLGLALPRQALEGRHPSKPQPPPLSRPFLSLLAAASSILGVSLRYRHSSLALHILWAPGMFGSRCSSSVGVLEASVSFVIS